MRYKITVQCMGHNYLNKGDLVQARGGPELQCKAYNYLNDVQNYSV